MFTQISNLINEYKESIIQSEAEVRSKFIVPLLSILGYPSYLRAEEFPVYGFGGSKPLPPKAADFILFSDKNFAEHRKINKTDIDWVHENSLLIVEAKKPNEMPDIQGQAQYYTFWTRAVAYLAIDGKVVKGYYYNPINKDKEIIDCSIDDLPSHQEIQFFSYETILEVKQTSGNANRELLSQIKTAVTEEDVKDMPEHTLQYLRYALGANATGLSNLQLLSRYIHMTDAYLQNDMRYDIPEYMLGIPRTNHCGHLYIGDFIFPHDTGTVIVFYRNETEIYQYASDHIRIEIITESGIIESFNIGFRALENRVIDRLAALERIEKVLFSKELSIILDRPNNNEFTLQTEKSDKKWSSKERIQSLFNIWRQELEQLRTIEEFYDITFDLSKTDKEFDWKNMHLDVESIYNGIICAENCTIQLPSKLFDKNIVVEEPEILEANMTNSLLPKCLFGVNFVSEKSWILPCRVKRRVFVKKHIVQMPGCIRYKVNE